jgi:DNA-dependent RNA polymerase auxiliary subunit epsilon
VGSRAPDFRYIFANAVGIGVSDNECKVIFSVEEGPQEMYEQLGVAMTLKTTKMLAIHLSTIIEYIEKVSGTEIPYEKEKQENLIAALNAANLVPTAA